MSEQEPNQLNLQYQNLHVQFNPVIFWLEAQEMGLHTLDSIQHFSCAWYFCRCAHESIETFAKDIVLEGETDSVGTLRQVLSTCMKLYNITDIEKLIRFVSTECRQLAFRRNLFWDSRFQAWIDSGGHSYNEMSREEKAINKS